MGQTGALDVQHLGHTGDLRSGSGSGAGIAASHQHMDITAAGHSGSDGVQGGALDGRVVVFGNDE